ncbi:hypothetical protein [Kineosporia sp. NBRC 101731]|uniref:hypothetical protein n=1 Tax=Kineosporia sp. NBRC 101731 TaxID=3032199 RepID=UPI0024A1ABAE|nr:hypothetical protein [Kineosporia sp. NBRC 101731]GLY27182.1 hypothetical protein Kisp02_05470 [Kineosporia sp. NBRC 101731]
MRIFRRSAVGLAAATLLAPLALLAPGTSASAATAAAVPTAAPESSATECKIIPSSVTLYEQPKSVIFDVERSFPDWSLRILDAGAFAISDMTQGEMDASELPNWIAGDVETLVRLWEADPYRAANCRATFSVLRGSRISLSAQKISGGRKFTGSLKAIRFGWSLGGGRYDHRVEPTWAALAGRPVKIQYRAASGRWVTATTTKTTANGTFKVSKKLGKHQWRAVYAGSSTTGARTSRAVTR